MTKTIYNKICSGIKNISKLEDDTLSDIADFFIGLVIIIIMAILSL